MVILHLSLFILDETSGVLRNKLSWELQHISEVIAGLREICVLTRPKKTVTLVENHPADNQVLACAMEACADFLITGDKKHLLPLKQLNGTRIVTPHDFLALFPS